MSASKHNYSYICPFCKGHLRLAKEIIFLTKTKSGQSSLVLLSPEIGDYNVVTAPNTNYESGEHVNFICPICYENLDAKDYGDNLAKIYMVDKNGKQSEILFSKIVGEKCTYKISGEDVESFGDNANKYTSYFWRFR